MITWTGTLRVFACLEPVDMRKSFDGLGGLVVDQMKQDVESGQLFLFFNRSRNRVKILQAVEDGMILFYKRLEKGTFEVPKASAPDPIQSTGRAIPATCLVMRVSDLTLILAGIDLGSVRQRKRWRRPLAHQGATG